MDSLRIGLRRRCGAVGHVDADVKWPHDIHPNQDRRRFEADDDDETGSSSSFAPLEAKVLGLPYDLEWFAVGTVDDPLERLQETPLGTVLPPHREMPMQFTEVPVLTRPRTGMPSRLSWPVMGGPTSHPTGVTLASGDPFNSLTVRWGEFRSRPQIVVAPVFALKAVRERRRSLADGEGAGELDGPGSWRRNALPLRRGSSAGVIDPSDGEEDSRTEDAHCILGRGGEQEREREEAVERLRWQELEPLPVRWQGLRCFYGRRSVRRPP